MSGYSEVIEEVIPGQEVHSPPPYPGYQQQYGGGSTHMPAASGSPGDEDDYEHALIPDRYLNVSSKLVQYTITLHYNLLCIHIQCRFIVQSIDLHVYFKSRLFKCSYCPLILCSWTLNPAFKNTRAPRPFLLSTRSTNTYLNTQNCSSTICS